MRIPVARALPWQSSGTAGLAPPGFAYPYIMADSAFVLSSASVEPICRARTFGDWCRIQRVGVRMGMTYQSKLARSVLLAAGLMAGVTFQSRAQQAGVAALPSFEVAS